MTYYIGRRHPDEEARGNKYATKPSKFTEEVAAQVQDGDLYLSMSMPASGRYYVPVSPGEHGLEVDEGQLICVTHTFKKPYPDLPGEWKSYDGGGNIVIKIGKSSYPESAVMEAVERALYRTPLGRVVGREPLRAMTESLLKTFGIEYLSGDDTPSTYTLNTDGDALAKSALLDLLTFAPESGYDDRLGDIGAEADGVGFAENNEQYAYLLNGKSDGFGKKAHKSRRGRPLPLMSQPVFYAVCGYKGNGRAFQARINSLMQAVGLTDDELHDHTYGTNDEGTE